MQQAGATAVALELDGTVIGAITVRDELRLEARLTRASAGLVRAACG